MHEIGAGTGLCSLAAAARGATVLATHAELHAPWLHLLRLHSVWLHLLWLHLLGCS